MTGFSEGWREGATEKRGGKDERTRSGEFFERSQTFIRRGRVAGNTDVRAVQSGAEMFHQGLKGKEGQGEMKGRVGGMRGGSGDLKRWSSKLL